ncbi:hypothetical protein ACWD4F_07780 [Streptomyces aureus]
MGQLLKRKPDSGSADREQAELASSALADARVREMFRHALPGASEQSLQEAALAFARSFASRIHHDPAADIPDGKP